VEEATKGVSLLHTSSTSWTDKIPGMKSCFGSIPITNSAALRGKELNPVVHDQIIFLGSSSE
jgi:hypothetical protein